MTYGICKNSQKVSISLMDGDMDVRSRERSKDRTGPMSCSNPDMTIRFVLLLMILAFDMLSASIHHVLEKERYRTDCCV